MVEKVIDFLIALGMDYKSRKLFMALIMLGLISYAVYSGLVVAWYVYLILLGIYAVYVVGNLFEHKIVK